jgi:glycosyltransferase involved in cell wall biosynthesis
MPASPRIYFVNRFYWPDETATAQLLTDLTERLAAQGHAISVITTRPPNYSVDPTLHQGGIEVIRTGGRRSDRSSIMAKALSFVSFSARALRVLSKRLQPHDIVVLMTDPPLLSLLATSLSNKRGAHVVHWLQDIYPEVAAAVGRSAFTQTLIRKRDRAWLAADICVAPCHDMARYVTSRGMDTNRVLVSPNWAPHGVEESDHEQVERLRKDWGLVGKFVVMYSGNLGRVHELDPILEAAEELRSEPDIVFLFVGGGAQKSRLQAKASGKRLTNVIFKPAQPRIRLGTTLAMAHLHLVTLKDGCEAYVFPSKFHGIVAAGKPTLFIGPKDCELSRLVTARDIGKAYAPHEVDRLVQTIRHLRHAPADCARMGKLAKAYSVQTGGLDTAVFTWDRLLSGVKSLTPRSSTSP